ncbi:hypothetical protein [Granulicella sp. L46]|uniref:hypothetical protein n=1 Tax=Granulicella sp. L46 TaxID=1641865 RepID=UPI00131C685D|nr:hypothetical protein [Granulicella sp. L46]
MDEPDLKIRLSIAALCGALGVASGYAIFLKYDEIWAQPWRYFAALIGAAAVSYVIDLIRDVIRDGEIEPETHPIVRSLETFVVVLLFELFIGGFDAGLERGLGDILKIGVSLLGDDAATVEGTRWTIGLVSGMWIFVGAQLTCWLSLQIRLDEDEPTARHVMRSARWGTIGGVVIAPALIFLYILGGRTLVALQDFKTNAPAASGPYVSFVTWFQSSNNNFYLILLDLPTELLRLAGKRGLPFFWCCYAGLVVVLLILVPLREHRAVRKNFSGFFNIVIFGVLYCIFNPIVRSIWAVLVQLNQHKSWPDVFGAVLLGAAVWGIPGLLLGGLVPLLKRAGRNPQSWAFIGYGAAALLILASILTGARWPIIPALVALLSGLLFQRGMPVKQFWPFAALCVAIGISGATSVSQRFTFSGVLIKLHHIDELTLRPPDASHRVAQASPKACEDSEKAEKDAKVLEIAITGSVGFWTTVGLLACWSLYEREHPAKSEQV